MRYNKGEDKFERSQKHMDVSTIITAATDFFKSIPWENVIQSFIDSVAGINWDSLKSLFDGFDFTGGSLQAAIDVVVAVISSFFGG